MWRRSPNRPFAERLEKETEALYRFCLYLTRQHTDAQDLVQETLVRALTAARQPSPDENLKPWLFLIARNHLISQVRRQRKGLEVIPGNEDAALWNTPATGGLPRQGALEHLTARDVQKALMSLPQEQREVVLLVDVNGFSYQQAAGVLQTPVGTVRSRLARARLALAVSLAAYDPHRRSAPSPQPSPRQNAEGTGGAP